jgi:hypothetical protein
VRRLCQLPHLLEPDVRPTEALGFAREAPLALDDLDARPLELRQVDADLEGMLDRRARAG